MRTLFDAPANLVRTSSQEVAIPTDPYEKIRMLEALAYLAIPEDELTKIDEVTSHDFCDGVYRRGFFLAQGDFVISKMHAHENWFLLFSGDVSIYAGDGTTTRVKAPFMMVTVPGTKRLVYAHEDSMIYNFHSNPENETDPVKLEAKFIIPEGKPTLPPALARKLLGRD